VTGSAQQARQLAAILRAGALPLSLVQIGHGG
jgi:preprotein translocase subunit SecD